jgi:hypothetical protein
MDPRYAFGNLRYPTIISRELWVAANVNLVKELGAQGYLEKRHSLFPLVTDPSTELLIMQEMGSAKYFKQLLSSMAAADDEAFQAEQEEEQEEVS